MMPHKPCLLCQQPEEIKTEIVKMARTQHYAEIVDWLHDQDIPATWDQVRYFVSKSGTRTRLQTIKPVAGYKAKMKVYGDLLLEYDCPTYTIYNLRLRGPSWSCVTKRLHADRLIEPMRDYAPIRWRILASKDELREWMQSEEKR